jgi:predicted Zn-dependent peptidase
MRSLVFLLTAALALGCAEEPQPVVPPAPTEPPAPAPAPVTPDADFRQQAPAPGAELPFVPPQIQEARLSNGVRVLLVERHELPIVAVRVVTTHGAEVDGVGVGSFAGSLFTSGTKTRSALEISDAFEALGAEHGAWVDEDGAGVSVRVLAPKLHDALALLADIAQHPSFPKDEVERERSRRLTEIGRTRDVPGRVLHDTLLELLYPAGHPYARSLLGTEEAVEKMAPADLQRFHKELFQPDGVAIAVAGDVTQKVAVEELERAFGKWKGKAKAAKPPAEPPFDAKGPRLVVIDRPGATQSNVQVVDVGVPRSNKDHDALLLMNTILGGQFSSRINLNLREKHAYTYGAHSHFDERHGAGPFTAGGAIKTESTAAAIKEIFAELNAIRSAPVTEEELADAKGYIVKQIPAWFETAGGTASTLGRLVVHGLPLTEYATLPDRLKRVTREDVQRVAAAHVRPERLRVVIVGDAAKIKESLAVLGLGEAVVRPLPSKSEKKPVEKTPKAAGKK